jgi:hypothetical protein
MASVAATHWLANKIPYHNFFLFSGSWLPMSGGLLVTTAWRVLRLRMEGRPPDMDGNYEYIE